MESDCQFQAMVASNLAGTLWKLQLVCESEILILYTMDSKPQFVTFVPFN